jgi:Sec7-like guanine-nucleotide exchange factor
MELPQGALVDDAALARVRGPTEALDKAAELVDRKAKKKMRKDGIVLFNGKPKKGIAQLQAQGLLSTKPAEIAQFLRATEGLDYAAIGDYLSDPDEECKAVRFPHK